MPKSPEITVCQLIEKLARQKTQNAGHFLKLVLDFVSKTSFRFNHEGIVVALKKLLPKLNDPKLRTKLTEMLMALKKQGAKEANWPFFPYE